MCERWVNFERLLIVNSDEIKARASEKTGLDEGEGPPRSSQGATAFGREGDRRDPQGSRTSRARQKAAMAGVPEKFGTRTLRSPPIPPGPPSAVA